MSGKLPKIEKIFLIVTLFFGFLFLFVNPPFQSPDEPEHFFKMYGYTKGTFIYRIKDGKTGLVMPESFVKMAKLFKYLEHNFFATTSPEIMKNAVNLKLEKDKTTFHSFCFPTYLPVSYFPLFLLLKLLLVFNLSPFVILIIMRISELFLYTGLMWLAIRITPVKKTLFAFLAMLPMAIYMGSSVNTDALVMGTGFIICAYFFKLAYDENITEISKKHLFIISFLSFLITICKPAYVPLFLLFFIIPKSKFSSEVQRWKYFFLVFASAVGAFLIYFLYSLFLLKCSMATNLPSSPILGAEQNSNNIILTIITHPVYFLTKVQATLVLQAGYFVKTFVGCFGWLDAQLPVYVILFYFCALLILAVSKDEDEPEVNIPYRDKLIFFAVFYLSFIIMTICSYLVLRLAEPYILGVQGRYFIPIAPVIFMMPASSKFKTEHGKLLKIVLSFSLTGLFISVYFLILRYYFPVYF